MSESTAGQPRRVVRFPAVRNRVGISRTTIWRLEAGGLFPKRVQIGPAAIGWFEDEIEAWLAARPRIDIAPTKDLPEVERSLSAAGGGHG
jgi:prophage regulatory protein